MAKRIDLDGKEYETEHLMNWTVPIDMEKLIQLKEENNRLAAQNAELIETMKWIHNHGGLGYSIHGALEKAIAKAYSPDPFADKVGAV